jgi:hypothetical protein
VAAQEHYHELWQLYEIVEGDEIVTCCAACGEDVARRPYVEQEQAEEPVTVAELQELLEPDPWATAEQRELHQRALQQTAEQVRQDLDGEPTHRIVIEIDARLVDPTWTEEDLLLNAVDYIEGIISRAERRNSGDAYRLSSSDITVWLSREEYLADQD